MFLVKAAFWLTIVLLLLPADPESGEPAPRVNMIEAAVAAGSAIRDISRLCERQPDACETGGHALKALGQKLRYGSELVQRYFNSDDAPEAEPASLSGSGLTSEEMQIPWRKPGPDTSA
jgi:hypothetical protein